MSLVPAPKPLQPSAADQQPFPTTPQRDATSSQQDGDRRPPSNLQGILNWVLSQDPNITPTEEAATQLDEEKKQFLQGLLTEMTERDHMSQVKQCLEVLNNQQQHELDDVHEALEILAEECEDINVAQDFVTLRGLLVVLAVLTDSRDPGSQWRAAQAVTAVVQNFPDAQEAAHKEQVVKHLVRLIPSEDQMVRFKCIGALSALVRGHSTLLKDFQQVSNSLDIVVQYGLKQGDKRVVVKALVFLRHLLHHDHRYKEEFATHNIVGAVAELLRSQEDASTWDHGLHLLSDIKRHQGSGFTVDQAFQEAALARKVSLLDLSSEEQASHREELEWLTLLFGS